MTDRGERDLSTLSIADVSLSTIAEESFIPVGFRQYQ